MYAVIIIPWIHRIDIGYLSLGFLCKDFEATTSLVASCLLRE